MPVKKKVCRVIYKKTSMKGENGKTLYIKARTTTPKRKGTGKSKISYRKYKTRVVGGKKTMTYTRSSSRKKRSTRSRSSRASSRRRVSRRRSSSRRRMRFGCPCDNAAFGDVHGRFDSLSNAMSPYAWASPGAAAAAASAPAAAASAPAAAAAATAKFGSCGDRSNRNFFGSSNSGRSNNIFNTGFGNNNRRSGMFGRSTNIFSR